MSGADLQPMRPTPAQPTRLAILGGSSPFTVGLFNAIASQVASLPPAQVILNGRDRDALEVVAAYGRHKLTDAGWTVTSSADIAEAVEGATLVVHQIRYGGLERRLAEEQLSGALGVLPDETLGPAALHSVIAMCPELALVAAALRRSCPDATILNLTNPLSCSTSLLQRWTSCRVVGLCELPRATLESACQVLEVDASAIDWSYTGLNHRGFIHRIVHNGEDRLGDLTERLGDGTIGGISAQEIDDLGALPLKYFALTRAQPSSPPPSRAQFLVRLRADLLAELRRRPHVLPPSLSRRPPDWYDLVVVPMIGALGQAQPRELVVNATADDGVTREVQANVSSEGIMPTAAPAPSGAVAAWLDRFEIHERKVHEAIVDPSGATVAGALERDPSIPASRVRACTRALLGMLQGDLESSRDSQCDVDATALR